MAKHERRDKQSGPYKKGRGCDACGKPARPEPLTGEDARQTCASVVPAHQFEVRRVIGVRERVAGGYVQHTGYGLYDLVAKGFVSVSLRNRDSISTWARRKDALYAVKDGLCAGYTVARIGADGYIQPSKNAKERPNL